MVCNSTNFLTTSFKLMQKELKSCMHPQIKSRIRNTSGRTDRQVSIMLLELLLPKYWKLEGKRKEKKKDAWSQKISKFSEEMFLYLIAGYLITAGTNKFVISGQHQCWWSHWSLPYLGAGQSSPLMIKWLPVTPPCYVATTIITWKLHHSNGLYNALVSTSITHKTIYIYKLAHELGFGPQNIT